MRTINLFITALLVAFSISLNAQQWTRITNLPASDFGAIEIIDGILYTGSGQKIYYSTDTGETWQNATFTAVPVVEVKCFKKFGSQLYVGTSDGIFSAALDNLNGSWSHHIASGWITSFAEQDGVLYASSTGVGIGVFKHNANGSWSNFSNGIPNYSGSVNKMLATPAGLLAFAGANGTFYKYDKITADWIEDYYGSGYQVGLDFEDAALVGNSIYVSRSNKVLRSDDFGINWTSDQVGLNNGHTRTMAVGNNDLYAVTTVFTGDTNLTWLCKRDKNAPAQTNWSGAETLDFFSYALAESGDKAFIASNQGIYIKDASLGTVLPLHPKAEPVIFPNPSPDGRFILKSPEAIDELNVYDLMGKLIMTRRELPAYYEFTIPGQGLYFVRTISGKTLKTFKVIAKCRQ
jgi:hypothetical protein